MIHMLARQIHLPIPYLVLELAYYTPAHHTHTYHVISINL